ncbi:hypothetical protein L1049_006835 [Liquidambar formosana]|uniref:Uncharacterized protein n=1 Tax=Liquidambar formosana TaxID=63359 RepID=A0AAP0RHW7_LIQFO
MGLGLSGYRHGWGLNIGPRRPDPPGAPWGLWFVYICAAITTTFRNIPKRKSLCNTEPPSQTRSSHQLLHLRMGKVSSASDVDGSTSTAYNTVFIDTSLDTHIAMIASDADTVSDLKKRIMYEHPLCFPDTGEIKIHALKVKRKGYFYHLSDSMLVKSAFDGIKKNWFLCVDASSLVKHGENRLSCNPDSSNVLVCVTNNPSADRVDLLPDGPSQRLSILDVSSLGQDARDQYMNQNIPDVDQFVPGDSVREASKDLETEVKHISHDRCKISSSDTNKGSDPEIQDKNDLIISEQNETVGTPSECKKDNSQNVTSDMQCGDTLEGASKNGSVARKKHKIRKKIKNVVDDHALKDNGAPIDASSKDGSQQEIIVPQNCSGSAGKEVSNDMKMGTNQISDELHKSSSSGISKSLDSAIQKNDELCDGIEVPGTHVECKDKLKDKVVDVQCNNLLGEASQSRPATKKKRGIEKKIFVEDPSKEKEILVCNSSKEASKPDNMISDKSLEDKQNRTDATYDGLSNESPQDGRLMKRKRKRKSSDADNQVVAAVPCSVKETVGFDKDSGKESDAATVPGQSFQGAKHSESCAIFSEGKAQVILSQEWGKETKYPVHHLRYIADVPADCFVDVDMNDIDAESKGDASDVAAGVSRSKSLKKHHAFDGKGHPSLVAKEPDNLDKLIRVSGHDNFVTDDHQNFGTDQAHKIEEGRELSQNSNPELMLSESCKPSGWDETGMTNKEALVSSKLLDGNRVVEPGKSSDMRRKSKKAKKSDGEPQVTSGQKIRLFGHDNIVAEDHLRFETDQAHKMGEGRELSQNSNPELMLSEKCKPSSWDETGMNNKEAVVSSKLLDGNGVVEPGKSSGKRSKSKKAKKSVGELQETSGVEHAKGSVSGISAAQPHEAFNSIHSTDEAKREESILSKIEKKEVSNIKTVNTDLLGADCEAAELSGNEVEFLQRNQINQTQENPANMEEKVRKKPRKKQSSTVKNLPDVQEKEQDVGPKDLTPSTDKIGDVDGPSKRKKNSKLAETSSKDQLDLSNWKPGKETGNEIEPFHPQRISETADSSQVQGRPLQANVDDNTLKSGRMDEANKNLEASISESDRINFNDYFVPSQCQHEVASVEALADKVTKAKRSGGEMKAKKNLKKVDGHSLGTSLELQSSLKFNNDRGSEKQSQGGNPSTIQGLLSKDESDKLLPRSDRKSSKVSENSVEAQPSNGKFIPKEARRPNVVKASKTSSPAHANSKVNTEASVASSSSLGRSKDTVHKHQSHPDQYHMTARKGSNNNIGELVNSANHEKSLLATAGNIFKDGNSESSEDDGVEDSDASTRTSSDDSSSSDHSEVETQATGSYGTKRKEVGSKNILNSNSSGLQNVTLDTILRSSSRYKKAKLTASQLQLEDTESQPVDFVPDSQANP